MKLKNLSYFLLFLIVNFAALWIGTILMNNGPQSEWYKSLQKAPWSPPGWFFGFAWTTIMICYSFYMTKLVQIKNQRFVLKLFALQWFLNVSWNYIFFNQQFILLGFFVIIVLTFIIGIFLFFYKKSLKTYTALIVPYFLWLLIAMSLNGYIFVYNFVF